MKENKKGYKVLEKVNRNVKGITLVALVVTIIVLLILSVVVISLTIGTNGIFNRAEKSANEYNKQEATEKVNLKITSTQIKVYTESQRMPTLQEIADDFCKDNEVQYVTLERKRTASIRKIEVGEAKSIFTKLKNYPYEFEIDSSLKLASINGIKLAENENDNSDLIARIEQLENDIKTLKTENNTLKQNNDKLTSEVDILKNETILNKRIKLTDSNFTPIELSLPTTQGFQKYASIQLTDSIRNYKYLEIQIESRSDTMKYWGNKTTFVSTERLEFNNTDALSWKEGTSFTLMTDWVATTGATTSVACYCKNEKEIIVASGQAAKTGQLIRIVDVHGIK